MLTAISWYTFFFSEIPDANDHNIKKTEYSVKCTSLSIEIIVSNENALKLEAGSKHEAEMRSVQSIASTRAILRRVTF